MTENRMALLSGTEDEAHEVLLNQLAKAHAAESRAAEVVTEEFLRDRYRYAAALGWLRWDGARWDDDQETEDRVADEVRLFMDAKERDYRARYVSAIARIDAVVKSVKSRLPEDNDTRGMKPHEIVDQHGDEADAVEYNAAFREGETSKQQADMWHNLLSGAKIRSITSLCRAMDGIRTRTTDLDQDGDTLNCANGVVDLRTGEITPHHPSQLNTKVAGAAYDPTARSKWFDLAIEAAHPDAREWFKVRCGQALTGYTPEDDSLVLCSGGGENGKTSVMTGVMRAAGDYGRLLSHRVLLATPGQHPTEMMDLRGLRLALLEETPEEGHLDTHQLKTTVGTTWITARHMRKDSVTFKATHSMFINTNFPPQVDSTDHGTWRRLKAMSWPFRYVTNGPLDEDENERRGDPAVKAGMIYDDDVPAAVLAWLVEGAMAWYANGQRALDDPEAVEQAGSSWREKSDVAYLFALDRLTSDPSSFITAAVMKAEFERFLTEQNKKMWSAQLLNTRLPASIAAAGLRVDTDPTRPAKVRSGDTESRPADAGTADEEWRGGYGGPTFPARVDIQPGKAVRMWRGLRFKTEAEMSAGHLRAV